ncbi:MAG: DinB family protein [Acidobacteriota bacterium]|nr:DinB family protein [Acidobacteriota bacterium]
MKTIAQEDYTGSFFQLLKETFEGPPADKGSAYLDKGAGLFQTLDALTAEAASARPWPGATTVAAHCEHVRFYVLALYDFMRGATGKVDWGRSWVVQSVSPAEWDRLREDLRRAYATVTEHLRSAETWGDAEVGDGMAILVHTAYHLGAIRQLIKEKSRES